MATPQPLLIMKAGRFDLSDRVVRVGILPVQPTQFHNMPGELECINRRYGTQMELIAPLTLHQLLMETNATRWLSDQGIEHVTGNAIVAVPPPGQAFGSEVRSSKGGVRVRFMTGAYAEHRGILIIPGPRSRDYRWESGSLVLDIRPEERCIAAPLGNALGWPNVYAPSLEMLGRGMPLKIDTTLPSVSPVIRFIGVNGASRHVGYADYGMGKPLPVVVEIPEEDWVKILSSSSPGGNG